MFDCVAVVGQQNNPLFLHVLDPVEPSPLRYDFLIYSSLDALDAKLREQDEALASHALQKQAAKATGAPPPADMKQVSFLGSITVTPEHQVYAFTTTTGTKIVVAVATATAAASGLSADAINQKCEAIYRAYSRAVSNPFHTLGAVLESQKFTQDVERISRMEVAPTATQAAEMAASSMF